MGLDYEDIIIHTEDAFNINILDKEAIALRTVGDLHKLVLSKISDRKNGVCPTSAAFYRFRQALCKTLGYTREQIQPATSLYILFPPGNREVMWDRLLEESQLPLPGLEAKGISSIPLIVLLSAWIWIIISHSVIGVELWGAYFACVFALIALAIVLCYIVAKTFPDSVTTVGDVARIIAHNLPDKQSQVEQASYEMIRKLTSECLSIDESEITLDKRFIEDLGVG